MHLLFLKNYNVWKFSNDTFDKHIYKKLTVPIRFWSAAYTKIYRLCTEGQSVTFLTFK